MSDRFSWADWQCEPMIATDCTFIDYLEEVDEQESHDAP